jgi:hypothetical protein
VLISSHRKLLWSKATVVSVAEKSGHDAFRLRGLDCLIHQFKGRKVEFSYRGRVAEQVALDLIYAGSPEQLELLFRFDAFGRHCNIEAACESKDRGHHSGTIGAIR